MVMAPPFVEFLVSNMKEMETELRAHSIVLEALEQQVITPDEIPGSLTLARQSHAMLAFVEEKYRQFPWPQAHENAESNVDFLYRLAKSTGGYSN